MLAGPGARRHVTYLSLMVGDVGHAIVTTTIRLRFDGRSTAYQSSLRSRRRNAPLAADPLDAFSLIYLFA